MTFSVVVDDSPQARFAVNSDEILMLQRPAMLSDALDGSPAFNWAAGGRPCLNVRKGTNLYWSEQNRSQVGGSSDLPPSVNGLAILLTPLNTLPLTLFCRSVNVGFRVA